MRRFLDAAAAWQLVQETIPIVHVHGSLGAYPDVPYSIFGRPQTAAEAIKIIHEFEDSADGFCSADFETANSLLQCAEVIHAVGFAMADANMRRLRFFQGEASHRFHCCAGRQNGLVRTTFCEHARKYGFAVPRIISTTANHYFGEQVTL